MMILYINESPKSKTFQYKESALVRKSHDYNIYFDNTITITDKIHTNIINLIDYHKPSSLIVKSLNEFEFSPTLISEMLMKIVDKDVSFYSIDDNIYLTKQDKLDVYPTIFTVFRNK